MSKYGKSKNVIQGVAIIMGREVDRLGKSKQSIWS